MCWQRVTFGWNALFFQQFLHIHFSRSLRQRWNTRERCHAEIRTTRWVWHHERHGLHSGVERAAGLYGSTCGLCDRENHTASLVQPKKPFETSWHCHIETQRDRKVFGFHSAHLFADERIQQRISSRIPTHGDRYDSTLSLLNIKVSFKQVTGWGKTDLCKSFRTNSSLSITNKLQLSTNTTAETFKVPSNWKSACPTSTKRIARKSMPKATSSWVLVRFVRAVWRPRTRVLVSLWWD